jgi:serine/threonine protein kinase
MAPETVKKLENTRYSDIWSLGCTILEMLQGVPPWNKYQNPLSVLNHIYKSENPPEIPNFVSPVLKDFLEKCLAMDPKDRWNIYLLKKHTFVTGDFSENIYKTISEEFSLHVDDKSISNINNNIKAGCVKKKKLRNVDNNKTFNNSYEDA